MPFARGTIVDFDAADGLGTIALDDGRRIRFGLGGCRSFVPAAGMRVRVGDLKEVLGRPKATWVELLAEGADADVEELVWPAPPVELAMETRYIDGVQREVRVRRRPFDRDAFQRTAGAWASPAAFRELVFSARPAAPATLPGPHPFFEPWHDAVVATAVACTRLAPAEGDEAGHIRGAPSACFGGTTARLPGRWPACARRGHGAMTLLLATDDGTLFACVRCANEADGALWLGGDHPRAAFVRGTGPEQQIGAATNSLPAIPLASEAAAMVPPSWMFLPRYDVQGHRPVGGVASALFDVLVTTRSGVLEKSSFAYDRHYGPQSDGVHVGGFAPFRFAICPTCSAPMRQVLYLSDYFSGGALPDMLDGRNELTLLSCRRTHACTQELLVLDP